MSSVIYMVGIYQRSFSNYHHVAEVINLVIFEYPFNRLLVVVVMAVTHTIPRGKLNQVVISKMLVLAYVRPLFFFFYFFFFPLAVLILN